MVRLPRPHEVVHRAQQRNTTCHQDRPIHSRNRNFFERRPEAEEEHKCKVHAGESVVCDTERTRDLPRSPDSAHHAVVSHGGRDVVECGAAGQDCSGAAAVEK